MGWMWLVRPVSAVGASFSGFRERSGVVSDGGWYQQVGDKTRARKLLRRYIDAVGCAQIKPGLGCRLRYTPSFPRSVPIYGLARQRSPVDVGVALRIDEATVAS